MTGRLSKPIAILSAAVVFLALLIFAPSEITRSTGFEVIAGAEEIECPYHGSSYIEYRSQYNGKHRPYCSYIGDGYICEESGVTYEDEPCTFNDYGQCIRCYWDCNHPSKEEDGKCSLCGYYEVSDRETAVSLIKKALLNRDAKVRMILTGAIVENQPVGEIENIIDGLYNEAITHTSGGNSALGDYIAKTIETHGYGGTYSSGSSGLTSIKTCYSFTYYTTAEQEQTVTNTLSTLYGDLNLSDSSLTDLEKVYKIYNWIASNVSYDYDNLNNEENKTKYTAYGALKDKKAVCQGFAALFYRMCLDNGIDCRIITGKADGGNHAWNIVNVDGKYYYADVTWDCIVIEDAANNRQAKPATFFYFLRGTLPKHTEEADSITGTITTSGYTMAGADEYLSAFKAIVADGAPKAVHLDGNEIPAAENSWYDIKLLQSGCIHTLTVNITESISDNDLKGLPLFSGEVEVHSYTNGKCTVCGAFEDEIGARLTGYTLSLSGNIGVNFYMELSEEIADSETAYMQFTLPNGTTEKVMVSAARKDTTTNPGTTYHIFPCEVAAKEMTADITAQMFDGSGTGGAVYTYTVKEYSDYVLEHTESYSVEAVSLVKAMLNYGACSQVYFGYNTDKLANESLSETDKALGAIQASDISTFTSQYTSNTSYTGSTAYYGSSLVLKSGTDIKHYFTYDTSIGIDKYTCTDSSSNSYEVAASGDKLYVRVENIPAHKLGEALTLTLYENGIEVGTITYSPMSYAYVVLNKYSEENSEKGTLRNVVIALYDYYTKAKAYIAA
ncbi:MAG: transglutaminase domain-containing protein [Ruminiclostridium sp.]